MSALRGRSEVTGVVSERRAQQVSYLVVWANVGFAPEADIHTKSVFVKVCGCRPHEGGATHTGARRTQTSKGGNRGRRGEVARQTLRGFGGCGCEYNFCDMAQTLRKGENAFRRSCNFRELGVVKRAHITTFALCA
jgi:hypothetical protein